MADIFTVDKHGGHGRLQMFMILRRNKMMEIPTSKGHVF